MWFADAWHGHVVYISISIDFKRFWLTESLIICVSDWLSNWRGVEPWGCPCCIRVCRGGINSLVFIITSTFFSFVSRGHYCIDNVTFGSNGSLEWRRWIIDWDGQCWLGAQEMKATSSRSNFWFWQIWSSGMHPECHAASFRRTASGWVVS